MQAEVNAALLLWLPALVLALATLNVIGRGGRAWKPVAVAALVLVLLAPLTVPSSDSTAAVLLMWEASIAAGPLVLGLVLIVFTGEVPVGRLPSAWRLVGYVLVLLSVWTLVVREPTFASVEAWNRFATALLAGVVSVSASLAVLHLAYIPRRRSRTSPLLVAAVTSAAALRVRGVEGSLAIGMVPELAGMLLGACLALLVVLAVVWVFERRMPEPEPLPPPSPEALARAAHIISMRPRGVLADE